MADTLILAGDIGGTKSHLGVFHGDPGAPVLVAERRRDQQVAPGAREAAVG